MQTINEAEKRALTHLEGKLHTGFLLLRSELETMKRRRDEINMIQRVERMNATAVVEKPKKSSRSRSRS